MKNTLGKKLFAAALFLFCVLGSIAAQKATGVYSTDFSTMTLSQSGRTVTGTYEHLDGRIEGVLDGTVLTGRWYQNNGEGTLRFVFSSDFGSFTGVWNYGTDQPAYPWNGERTGAPPPAENLIRYELSGTYTTDFGSLAVTRSGTAVTGTYEHSSGRIEGVLNGTVLTGWWYQAYSQGRFSFSFSSDFSSFTGYYSFGDAEPDSPWNGTRNGPPEPVAQGSGRSGSQSAPRQVLNGTSYTSSFGDIDFQQSGRTVTGNYPSGNGRIEAVLEGNVLTGKWYETGQEGRLRFVFTPDFSSFSGVWGYNGDEPTSMWDGERK
jgi:hypothetical protein